MCDEIQPQLLQLLKKKQKYKKQIKDSFQKKMDTNNDIKSRKKSIIS